MNVKEFIVKKVPAIFVIAIYALGAIGSPVVLAIDDHWPFAIASAAVSVLGIPYIIEEVKELFKKAE